MAPKLSNLVHALWQRLTSTSGYLLDQFLQTGSNKRTDAYGGEKVENRVRFLLEVVDAITSAIGQERTAVRLSPWSKVNRLFILPSDTQARFLLTGCALFCSFKTSRNGTR